MRAIRLNPNWLALLFNSHVLHVTGAGVLFTAAVLVEELFRQG